MVDSGHHLHSPGIYEQLITDQLQDQIAALRDRGWTVSAPDLSDASSLEPLARHVGDTVKQALEGMSRYEQVVATNLVLKALADGLPGKKALIEQVAEGPRHLTSLAEHGSEHTYDVRPSTPLSESALLTNAPDAPSLGPELEAELATADRVDLLCAFVKWSGLRVLEEPLREARQRGVPIRVITTTYMGATDRKALDRLAQELGAEVKVSYEVQATRLHAKAWLLHRKSGYSTAYVGSSNLSKPALLEGLEWNVRLSSVSTRTVLDRFRETFEVYWNDPAFEDYAPERDAERLDEALHRAGWQPHGKSSRSTSIEPLPDPIRRVHPHPYQRDMLDQLAVDRDVLGHRHNLLVAATGTGKTVMAALDYQRLREESEQNDLTLLFVAHRKEILEQSRRTYRAVLRDKDFGELYVAGKKPQHWQHVFASVQSLNSGNALSQLSENHFNVLVIDECHHGVSDTYKTILNRFQPQQLLGLTATPERADGRNIQDEHFDGRIAAEMRLWEALEDELLSPFHYFGIADNVDLTSIPWKRGQGYALDQLDNAYTGNDARAELVAKAVKDKVTDHNTMRALGFCVSRDHADYMARYFNEAGIEAKALYGTSSTEERDRALTDLTEGRIQVLFSVDLFNEGLDIPDVDTLLFLRPTSSATVFLQQFGRGLRRTPNKPVLTVLDFIGHHRAEFRFEGPFHALTGLSHRRLLESVKHNFPHLPAGCRIILDEQSKKRVVDNIRDKIEVNVSQLTDEVKAYGKTDLAGFLDATGHELKALYRNGNSWTRLLRRAKLLSRSAPVGEESLLKRVIAFLHVDDRLRVDAYKKVLADDAPRYHDLDPQEQAFARMLFFSVWPGGGGFSSYKEALESLQPQASFRREMLQVLDYNLTHTKTLPITMRDNKNRVPLSVHCSYSREELLSALDDVAIGGPYPRTVVTGVKWCKAVQTDALLITIEKSEKDFSPETRYRDYAVRSDLFHWESQRTTAPDSPVGERYQNHKRLGTDVLLFVRRYKYTDIGGPGPYTLIGPADYVEHTGSKPMSIIWKLHHDLPPDIETYARIAI